MGFNNIDRVLARHPMPQTNKDSIEDQDTTPQITDKESYARIDISIGNTQLFKINFVILKEELKKRGEKIAGIETDLFDRS